MGQQIFVEVLCNFLVSQGNRKRKYYALRVKNLER